MTIEGGCVDSEGNGHRRRRGFDTSRPIGSFVEVARDVLIEPARFFGELRALHEEEEGVSRPLLFAIVCSVVGQFLTYLTAPLDPLLPVNTPNPLYDFVSVAQNEPGRDIMGVVIGLALAVIATILVVYLVAVVQHLFVLVFVRERRGFRATFLVVAYQNAVGLVAWIPVLGLLASLYGVYIAAVGLREMHGTTTIRALLAVLVPYLLPFAWVVYFLWLLSTPSS